MIFLEDHSHEKVLPINTKGLHVHTSLSQRCAHFLSWGHATQPGISRLKLTPALKEIPFYLYINSFMYLTHLSLARILYIKHISTITDLSPILVASATKPNL